MAKSRAAHKRSKTSRRIRGTGASYRPSRWQRLWQAFWRFVHRENIDRIMLVLGILIGTSAVAISWVESIPLTDSLWWSIVTVTTVGYGDIAPATAVGRAIAMINMVIGVGVLAALSATLASILVERKMKEELGMSTFALENHIILCEWNYRAANILRELRMDTQAQDIPIVLIGNCDRKPLDDPNLSFIRGRVSDETLTRANLKQAKTVIILGNDQLDESIRDATAVLSTLTVESINPNVYTIVELVDPANAITCYRARANEVIISSEISSMLISQATINHGISKVISDLLSVKTGNQLYKVPLPPSKAGQTFLDIFLYMKQTYQSIVVALQRGQEGEVISNPDSDQIVNAEDYLIVISSAAPLIT